MYKCEIVTGNTQQGLTYRALKARSACYCIKHLHTVIKLHSCKAVFRHHATKPPGAVTVELHAFLTSALHASRSGCLTPVEGLTCHALNITLARTDLVTWRSSSCPCRESNPGSWVVQHNISTELSRLHNRCLSVFCSLRLTQGFPSQVVGDADRINNFQI